MGRKGQSGKPSEASSARSRARAAAFQDRRAQEAAEAAQAQAAAQAREAAEAQQPRPALPRRPAQQPLPALQPRPAQQPLPAQQPGRVQILENIALTPNIHIDTLARALGARANVVVDSTNSTCVTFDHPTRFMHPNNPGTPTRTLVVWSRETGQRINMQLQILQSMVYAIRYMNALIHIAYSRVIIQHVSHRRSVLRFPSVPTPFAFGGFFAALNRVPAGTDVDFMVRGWDGASTATGGMLQFIQAYGSGQGNNRNLFFRFVFFQNRNTTNSAVRALFGDPEAGAPLPAQNPGFAQIAPGPAPAWWPPAGNLGLRIEAAMRARVHPPFTHLDYLNAMVNLYQMGGIQAARTADSTLALLFVLSVIDSAKSDGAGIGANVYYNNGRNSFV